MKTLRTNFPELEARLATLIPADTPRWGTMSAAQALAHLRDACEMPLGKRQVSPRTGLVQRTVLKRLALRTSFPWVRNYPTLPEIEQGAGGTPPGDFDRDRADLLRLLHGLLDETPQLPLPHPIFGSMSREDWLIWAYKHVDHHLCQFGR